MKVAVETTAEAETWLKPMEFTLPTGLIGFPDAHRLELILNPDELPFMWLRCTDNHALNFIVVEPQGILPGYTIELGDDDVAQLGIEDAADTLLFAIVNFRADAPNAATANLIGPIVVNRHTGIGRQVVIANFSDYSARHALLVTASSVAAGN